MGVKLTKPEIALDGSITNEWDKQNSKKKKKPDIRHIADEAPIIHVFGCRNPMSRGMGSWDAMTIYAKNASGLEIVVRTQVLHPKDEFNKDERFRLDRLEVYTNVNKPCCSYLLFWVEYQHLTKQYQWIPMSKEDLQQTLQLSIPESANLSALNLN